jgi:hypothetical protein
MDELIWTLVSSLRTADRQTVAPMLKQAAHVVVIRVTIPLCSPEKKE